MNTAALQGLQPLLVWIERYPRWSDLLALLSGASLTLAFAPFEWRPLAVLLPVMLLLLCWPLSPKQAAWRGWLFGVGLFGSGVSWIYHSLHLFGDAVAPLAALLTLLFALAIALFFALYGYLLKRLPAAGSLGWLLVAAPALWVVMEWFRGWFLSGFPWLLLGYAHVDTPLSGFAPITGVLGLSWLSLLSGVLLLLLLDRLLLWRKIAQRRAIAGLIVALLLIWGGGALLRQMEWSQPVGEPIKVALIQGNVSQHQKFLHQTMRASIERYVELSLQQDADLIIWPETAIPTYFPRAEPLLSPLIETLRRERRALLVGAFLYDEQDSLFYNSLVDALEPQFAYHKQHLVPFGEYMPFRGLLEFLAQYILIPMSDLGPGPAAQSPLPVAGHKAGAFICYESAYSGVVSDALPEADFLVNISNDAWFGDSLAPAQHLEIARMRALELARPLVRGTNTGISALVGFQGQIQQVGPQFVESVVSGMVQPRQGVTPLMHWGLWGVTSLALVLLGWCVVVSRGALSAPARTS